MRQDSWEIAALPAAPGQARERVREFAALVGFPAEGLGDLLLCVSEAVTNAVMHAYRENDAPGRVEIGAKVEGHSLLISVRDDGTGMTPRHDSPGLGLGMPIIAALARSVDLKVTRLGGTEIVMRFPLTIR